MRLQPATTDAFVAKIASRQHGVVTFEQLLGAGLTQAGIQRRVAAGRLHRVYRGVYAVGHAGLSSEGKWFAAVAACGQGAALSHRSAAELWTLLSGTSAPVHVTVAGDNGRSKRRGLVIHRAPSLISSDVTSRKRIAVTTPARTIADLRRTSSPGDVRRTLRQAAYLGLEIGEEGRGRDCARERSDLEERFLRLCHRHALPLPLVNQPVGPYSVDFLWPAHHLAVETDGWQAHRGRQAFEEDRERDAYLRLQGFEVLRFTKRQVDNEPGRVVAVLRRYLS
jgi:very-short-patch-repair endonuclease